MFVPTRIQADTIEQFYGELTEQLRAYADKSWLATLANSSALLYQHVPNLNWAGFYLYHESSETLILGPFQGLPACIRIAKGRGVCGAAVRDRKSYRVDDVDQFPGHIACDSASRSELVVPIIQSSRLIGVLDLDSPQLNRFSTADQTGIELFVSRLNEMTEWPDSFSST